MKKLNLGSGNDYRKGYVNIDSNIKFNPDILCDVKKLNFGRNEVDEILARDVLEHIPIAECESTLKEWHRVLKQDGKIIIQVPNIETIAKNIFLNGEQSNELHNSVIDIEYINTMIKRIFGGEDYEGNFHNNGFTPETIKAILGKVGFREIKVYPVKDLKTPNYLTNMVIEAKK